MPHEWNLAVCLEKNVGLGLGPGLGWQMGGSNSSGFQGVGLSEPKFKSLGSRTVTGPSLIYVAKWLTTS